MNFKYISLLLKVKNLINNYGNNLTINNKKTYL